VSESGARSPAERPEGESAFQGAPQSRRRRASATTAWPPAAACMSGVNPSASKWVASAPELFGTRYH
jgi:hypothetical protein